LWVTLRVAPPDAYLRVADDGRGLGSRSGANHFGLDVMRERSARVGASLTVRPRDNGGTIVEATLGNSPKTTADMP
jgi:nitrate/nitrite-specific signal transduction histidine kinase